MIEHVLEIPIFEDEIVILYGTEEELYYYWKECHFDLLEEYNPIKAKYWSIYDSENNLLRYILVVKGLGEDYLYHESLHATNDILEFHGVKVNNTNDEMQCLLMDWIAKSVTKIINERNGL